MCSWAFKAACRSSELLIVGPASTCLDLFLATGDGSVYSVFVFCPTPPPLPPHHQPPQPFSGTVRRAARKLACRFLTSPLAPTPLLRFRLLLSLTAVC